MTPSRAHTTTMRAALAAALTLVATATAHAESPSEALARLLASTPSDSLVQPLRRFEAEHGRLPVAGDAALATGSLHFARGEYRQAAESFARAAARLDPARKPEARYWAGLSWLGAAEPAQARAAFDEVGAGTGPLAASARLGLAQAWEALQRPDRALATLEELIQGDPGEAGPAALERYAVLADAVGKESQARKARERLLRDYPRSIEAASTRLALASSGRGASERGAVGVSIGAFIDPDRARALAAEARRAGFPDAHVVTRGEGISAVNIVWLGNYSDRAEARRAGEQAARALGVVYQTERMP